MTQPLVLCSYHFFIRFQGNLKDVSLLCLGQKEKHGLGLVGGRADKDHASLRIIQVILIYPEKGGKRKGIEVTSAFHFS